jgi:S-adenosylmethionine hydrolase
MSNIITLLTDFGQEDPYVGIMHGVIYGIHPEAKIADLSHSIKPQKVEQGAFLLSNSYRYLPASTVHIAVVDPGVGTKRRAIAIHIREVGNFIGPDNGIFSYILQAESSRNAAIEVYELTNPVYQLPLQSSTFHGRDIFAPAAAYLAKGTALSELGPNIPLEQLVKLNFQIPEWEVKKSGKAKRARGQIIHIDHFGNLITNFPASLFADLSQEQLDKLKVRYGTGLTITGLKKTYNQSKKTAFNINNIISLFNSSDYLEIAQINGDIATLLASKIGQKVSVEVPLNRETTLLPENPTKTEN